MSLLCPNKCMGFFLQYTKKYKLSCCKNGKFWSNSIFTKLKSSSQGVTRRCRLSWLTKSALVYMSPNAGGVGGGDCVVSAKDTAVHNHIRQSPNTLWRFNSIFNLCFQYLFVFWKIFYRQCEHSFFEKKVEKKISIYKLFQRFYTGLIVSILRYS